MKRFKLMNAMLSLEGDEAVVVAPDVEPGTGEDDPEAVAAAAAAAEGGEGGEGAAAGGEGGEGAAGTDTDTPPAATDEDDDEDDIPTDEDGVAVDTEDTAAAQNAETNEEATDIEDAAEDVDAIAEDAAALECFAVALEASMANGGMAPEAAAILQVAVESICMRWGDSDKAIPIPSMESFGGRTTRLASTETALNTIKNKAAEFYQATIRFLKGLWAKITGWIAKVLDNSDRIAKRAASIIEQAGKIGEAKPTTNLVPVSNLGNLAVKGVVAEGSALASRLEGYAAVIDKVEKSGKWIFDGAGRANNEAVEIMGNVRVILNTADQAVAPSTATTKVGTEAPVLTADEIVAVAKAVQDIATAIKGFKASWASRAAARDQALAKINQEAREAGKGGADASEQREIAATQRKLSTNEAKVMAVVVKNSIKGASTALDYCQKSINAHKAPKEAAAAAA